MEEASFSNSAGRMVVFFPSDQVKLKAILDGTDVTARTTMRLSADGDSMAVWYTHDDNSVERFTVPMPERIPEHRRCKHCKKDPCELIDNLAFILSFGESYTNQGRSTREIRYPLYRDITYALHGALGPGVRVPLP